MYKTLGSARIVVVENGLMKSKKTRSRGRSFAEVTTERHDGSLCWALALSLGRITPATQILDFRFRF
nr:hypothetical protein CFP56_21826 [Quercus suber]